MLTGIELFLAILPLVIAAAEHQKHIKRGVQALLSRKSKDEQQLDFYYELCDELSLLASTLGGLFAGLPCRSATDTSLKLRAKEQEALVELLGSRAESFKSILDRLLKHLENLVSDKSINIDRDDVSILSSATLFSKLEHFKTMIDNGGGLSSLAERFRFTRHERSRRCAMTKIKENNVKLERLLRGADTSNHVGDQMYKSTRRKPQSTRLRRFSEPLYQKIADKWPNQCECQSHHEARLCLWNCCSHQRSSRSGDSVDMIMTVSDIQEDGASWQESLILIPSESDPNPAESTVKFAVESPTTPSIPPSNDVDAESLCRLMLRAYGQQTTLQMVFKGGKLFQTRARRRSLGLERQRDVTLKELLEMQNRTRHFPLREQWVLAVVLAHAALHCSSGPWLSEDWDKEHITFFRSTETLYPDVRHPYLKLHFKSRVETDHPVSLYSVHPNPSLLSLGILLLEIYLKDTIESRWSPTDLSDGQPNENTNLTTALRLLEDSEGDVYEGYRSAIRACLDFDLPRSDAEDLGRKIYEEIVLPLEEELERGFHIKPEDLHLV